MNISAYKTMYRQDGLWQAHDFNPCNIIFEMHFECSEYYRDVT